MAIQTVDLVDSIVAISATHQLGYNLGMRHDDVYDINSLVKTPCYDAQTPRITTFSILILFELDEGVAAKPW